MDYSLTIVLPVHNAERELRKRVSSILELAVTAARDVRIAIVDDGSTDDTFETACELARAYPQVEVIRQPFQRGLGPALDRVRRTWRVSEVLAHDGISPFNLAELASHLRETPHKATSPRDQVGGSRRFAALATLHTQLEEAHRQISCFRWLSWEARTTPRRQARPIPAAAIEEATAKLAPSLAAYPSSESHAGAGD